MFAASVAAVALVGCARSTPIRLHDTSGATFDYWWDANKVHLEPSKLTPPPLACGPNPGWQWAWGRFFEICSGYEGGVIAMPTMCRLAVCNSDDECPVTNDDVSGQVDYACIHGICQQPGSKGNVVTSEAAILLCLSSQRATSCSTEMNDPNFEAAVAKVEASCPGATNSTVLKCTVPADCLQP